MYNEKMFALGNKRSTIREIFEYGKQKKAELGEDKVFDFSLGNPSVTPPPVVNETLIRLLQTENDLLLHGYSSAQGDMNVRKSVADFYNRTNGTSVSKDDVYMTVGAAASLCVSLNALLNDGEDVITFAPFFPEYKVFVEKAGGTLKALKPLADFQPDAELFASSITEKTKAVILNSPNNPSGVVVTEEKIKQLCAVLEKKEKQYGHPIYLLADEPYRELVYDGIEVPCLLKYYRNTIICYSYSKVISLPGERIGYIIVSPDMQDGKNVYLAVCGAGRALGYVCAPTLFQQLVERIQGAKADVSLYRKNRDMLYEALTSYGFDCVHPDGAFYLFVKAPDGDAYSFFEAGKRHNVLFVPGDDFGVTGYVRIAYCVTPKQIENSLPAFKALATELGLQK